MKLNTTGSYWVDGDGNLWSYSTKFTTTYKGYRIYNDSFFSMTTRKHQADMQQRYSYDIKLEHCGSLDDIECALKQELRNTEYEIELLAGKRNTKKKLATMDQLEAHRIQIKELLEV